MAAADTGSEEAITYIRGHELSMCRRGHSEFASRTRSGATIAIISTTSGNELVLIERSRPSLKLRVLELPSVWMEAADDAPFSDGELLQAARRSLSHFTGYLATSWRKLMIGPSAPGLCDEIVTYFRARNLERAGRTRSMVDIDPDIVAHYVPQGSFDGFLTYRRSENVLVDPLIYAAAWLAWGPGA